MMIKDLIYLLRLSYKPTMLCIALLPLFHNWQLHAQPYHNSYSKRSITPLSFLKYSLWYYILSRNDRRGRKPATEDHCDPPKPRIIDGVDGGRDIQIAASSTSLPEEMPFYIRFELLNRKTLFFHWNIWQTINANNHRAYNCKRFHCNAN